MNTQPPKETYDKLIDLALKGYTAVTIAEKLNLDVIDVSELMPTKEEREDMRASKSV